MLAGRVGGKATYNHKGLESMVDYLIKGSSIEITVPGMGTSRLEISANALQGSPKPGILEDHATVKDPTE